jgi:hypothetical protein
VIGLVQTVLAGTAWLLAVGWWVAPKVSTIGVDWQWLAWIPDWGWLIGVGVSAFLAAAMAGWSPSRRPLRLLCSLAAIVGPLGGFVSRDFGWCGAEPTPRVRLVFLNAQSPAEPAARHCIAAIEGLDPDLVVVSNPGWMAPIWRALEGERRTAGQAGDWTIQWRSPVLTASPLGACSLRTLVADGEIRAVAVGLPAPLAQRFGRSHLVVVDLPSDPRLDREAIVNRLMDGLNRAGVGPLDRQGLVVGDFNMTPRTPAMVRLRGSMADLVSEAGCGWTATWPRERPLLRIDQVLGDPQEGCRIETFDPGVGGHRGFVIDLPIGGEGPR